MDEETLLERFEAWHIEEHGWFDMKARICAERWAGFKAHAECCPVVVELPGKKPVPNYEVAPLSAESSIGWNCCLKECRAAIEAAGGRVAQC